VKRTAPPLAAIDVGSNTIHLVVVEPSADGRDLRRTLDDQLDLTRLGADVSATGTIGAERAARAVAAIRSASRREGASGFWQMAGRRRSAASAAKRASTISTSS